MTGPDDLDLRAGLARTASAIDVDDLDLDTVRTTVRRRRLRVRVGAGVGAAALLLGATVAVVAFNADDEPDTLATTDVDEQLEAAPTTVDDTPASTEQPTEPSTEQSTAPALTVQIVERAATVGQAVGVGGAPEYGEWTVAWQDGFLVGASRFAPQRLPDELPEEIIALFPHDVFGGELPATISEATQMLSDAGLLETVTEIIAANPAASEAIYSVESEPTPPTLDVRFTTDGVTWEPVEMTLPPEATYLDSVTSVDGRLVAMYQVQAPTADVPRDDGIRVASTQNLVDWTVQEIVVPSPPVELPDGAYWSVYANGVTVNDAGWVAAVQATLELDPVQLLSPDERAEYQQSSGYSSSFDGTGVTLERQVGDEWVTDRYTWEELGVAPEVVTLLSEQLGEPAMWAATWDGVPATSSGRGPTQQIVATSAGFVGLDERIWFSADGSAWTVSPLPAERGYVSSAFAFDGGVIAFVGTPDGVRVLRLDERGASPEWIEIPGLPEYVQGGFGYGSRLGVLVDLAEPGPPPPPLVVEADGHRLTVDNVTGAVEVVDLDTGELVVSGDEPRTLDDDGPISFGDDGVTVTDVTTGAVVVVFPAEEIEAASRALFDTEPSSEQEYLPDMWLLATTDGETFLLDDLDDGAGDMPFGFGTLAANGSRLLLQSGGNWVRYDLD
jgi:hypothetical protein